MLCMEYAMATVRLVNGIADSAQKGKVATSVASLASFAGELTLFGGACDVRADTAVRLRQLHRL